MFIFKDNDNGDTISKFITILAGIALMASQPIVAGILLVIAVISKIIYEL